MIYNLNSSAVNKANWEATAVFLFKFSSLIGHHKFKKWISSNKSIHPNFGEPTHNHLRKLLSNQLDRPLGLEKDGCIFKKLDLLGKYSQKIAEYISESIEVPVLKKNRKFVFSGDADNSIYDFLNRDNLKNIICLNNSPFLKTFEFWNGFHELLRFSEAKRTLTHPIEHKAFNKHLRSIPESSIAGNAYAGDLLCHDAAMVRKNQDCKAIIYYDLDKYSSFVAHDFEPTPPRTYSHKVQL